MKGQIKRILFLVLVGLVLQSIGQAQSEGIVSVKRANVREAASTKSKVIKQISRDQEVEIIDKSKSGKWYQVKHGETMGWMHSSTIKIPMVRLTNPTLKIRRSTQGPVTTKDKEPYGVPLSLIEDSPGRGGGIGTGRGGGIGSGRGIGSGSGSGSGSGDGSGSESRKKVEKPSPPKYSKGLNRPLQLLSKPRPGYTEIARKNNVAGYVILRVTFLANGQIGGVAPVKGLPHGLTERAIAAARQIKFRPKVVNGMPVSVAKRIIFNFSIY